MKIFFSALGYGFRKFIDRYEDGLQVTGIIALLIACVISGYCFSEVVLYENQLPTEEKYQVYETIVQQVSKMTVEELMNMKLPEKAQISVTNNEITISNQVSDYSVTGKFQNGLNLSRDSGQFGRVVLQIMVGGLLFGAILFVLSFIIISRLFKAFKSFSCAISHFRDDYKEKKKELEERVKLEEKNGDDK